MTTTPTKTVQEKTANNPTINKLARDEHENVRALVASNKNAPTKILTQLAQDEHENVRYCVANNPNTPTHLLTQLATDEGVRYAVAQNPNTQTETLKILITDPVNEVHKSANNRRKEQIKHYINQLPKEKKNHAQLLAPTFTGWAENLADVLTNLKKPAKAQNQQPPKQL